MSLSDIYPDKHEALSIEGQQKQGRRMQAMREVFTYEPWSKNARREKGFCHIDNCDTFSLANMSALDTSTNLSTKSSNT
jgi:hypothetical protein